ncbi:MAG: MarR family transcriptional regulator [Clostridia bacterium]|nr:MarR family transcriptional regulator [Clostridia bacterium]
MIERFEQFSLAIAEIHRYWHKIAADEMEKHDLKGTCAIYLTTMHRFPEGITAARLGEICGKDKSDVSRAVNAMEKKGLLIKECENKNLYRARLCLTEEGKAAAEQVRLKAAMAVELGGKGLSDDERRIFYKSLETIVENLHSISKEGLPE